MWHLGQADRNERTHLSFFCGMVLHILIEIVKISNRYFSNFHVFRGLSVFSFPHFVPVIGQGRVLCGNDFLACGVMGSSQNNFSIFQSHAVCQAKIMYAHRSEQVHFCTQLNEASNDPNQPNKKYVMLPLKYLE